jgi:NAD-dependent dihydropyrimidine dehydrogenase PreA subunit
MMFQIDSNKCNGCGYCVDACPQQAITIQDNLALINEELCVQCGTCIEVCPVGAIREIVPAYSKLAKGGKMMQYGYGRGFGFRGASPAWPYVGRGRGGLPRCWHPGQWRTVAPYPTSWAAPYWEAATPEGELGFLKNQADAMKSQLEDIERRIQELEKTD